MFRAISEQPHQFSTCSPGRAACSRWLSYALNALRADKLELGQQRAGTVLLSNVSAAASRVTRGVFLPRSVCSNFPL